MAGIFPDFRRYSRFYDFWISKAVFQILNGFPVFQTYYDGFLIFEFLNVISDFRHFLILDVIPEFLDVIPLSV